MPSSGSKADIYQYKPELENVPGGLNVVVHRGKHEEIEKAWGKSQKQKHSEIHVALCRNSPLWESGNPS